MDLSMLPTFLDKSMVHGFTVRSSSLDISQVKHLLLVVVAFVQTFWVTDTGARFALRVRTTRYLDW